MKVMKMMKKNNRMTTIIAMTALAGLSCAHAALINVNFAGADADDELVSTLSGPAGGLGTTWNQIIGNGSTAGPMFTATGATTTITVGNNFGLTADDSPTTLPIFQGSVANFGKDENATVIIGGLIPGGFYDIWLVSLRNQPFSGNGTEQYYGNWSTTNATSSSSSQLLNALGTVNASTFVDGYNYLLFEDVVATGGGEISFLSDPGESAPGVIHRLGLNGLQINQVPEPSSALLGGLGLLALVRRRR
jgi:hypothetical protein